MFLSSNNEVKEDIWDKTITINFFTGKWDLLVGKIKEQTVPMLSWVQGQSFVQGTILGMHQMSCISATMFSNSSAWNLVNPHFLEMWTFQHQRNLSLALQTASVTCSLLYSLVQIQKHYDLASVDPGHCALGLPKGTTHTCLEPRHGTACQSWMSTGKSCLQGPLWLPVQTTGCIHYQWLRYEPGIW